MNYRRYVERFPIVFGLYNGLILIWGLFLLSMCVVCVTYFRHPIHVWKGGSASIPSSGNGPEWSHSFSLKISEHNSMKPEPPCQPERWWCPRVCFHLALHGMAVAGLVETSFLTYLKIWGQGTDICQDWGCGDILFGPFSQFAGVPLTVPGMLGYGILACLSIRGIRRTQEDDMNGSMILALTTAMATFSCYLMAILFLQLGGKYCPYCIVSAMLSIATCCLSWIFMIVPDISKAIMTSFSSLLVTALASAYIFLATQASLSPTEMGGGGAIISASDPNPTSGDREMKLAKELQSLGSTMYGAHWCSHCQHQKEVLGAEPFSLVNYVECGGEENGKSGVGVDNGDKRRILQGYPTWEINGRLYPGEKNIQELERIVEAQKAQLKI